MGKRVIICGDRFWGDAEGTWEKMCKVSPELKDKFDEYENKLLDNAHDEVHMLQYTIEQLPLDTVIIQGEAPGADSLARDFGKELKFDVESYPAEWSKYGKAAGPVRNQQMLQEGKADNVIAFHHNIKMSRGTHDMVSRATEAGLFVVIIG